MENMTSEDYNRRVEAASQVITELQNEVNRLTAENNILMAEKTQWEQSKILQDVIITQTIGNSNDKYQQYAEEIQRLKDRLRKYEGD